MSRVVLDAPWLSFDLGAEMEVLSWSINRPGQVRARRILWRELRNADLPPDLDVRDWAESALRDRGEEGAVLFLTSRDVTTFEERRTRVGGVEAHAVATVGLSNGERVGSRVDYSGRNWDADWGTINVAVRLDAGPDGGLDTAGMLEAMSIAVQARTAAVMDIGFALPTGTATGTGTDCVALAAPAGTVAFSGLHTEIGEAIGRAVYDAVHAGTRSWAAERGLAR
ncbi:adenosylcobinamide amidohydrolase [Lutimaribacter marinistellae]|uniref:Adenosylcobinamide amidohydrolase n=1 Tax=Lutimaribacter marinistellae TaxID=1820329 RepID=A0ABV7TK80_9RHOB